MYANAGDRDGIRACSIMFMRLRHAAFAAACCARCTLSRLHRLICCSLWYGALLQKNKIFHFRLAGQSHRMHF